MPYHAPMNTFNRRDFVMGSTALGLLMASRTGLTANRHAAAVHSEADRLHEEAVARVAENFRASVGQFRPHDQAGEGRRGIVRMQGAQYEMTGQSGLEGNLRCFKIPDFSHHDNIGILT